MLPRASWAYDNDAKITEYNPQEVPRPPESPGAGNLTLKLWVPTSSQAWESSPLKTAELIQADMAQIGVKVIIVPVRGTFPGGAPDGHEPRPDALRLGDGQ